MTPEARAARERKQKIFVVVGGLLLLALLAFQLPRLAGGSSSAAPAEPATVAGDTTSTTPAAVPTGVRVALADTDRSPAAAPGTLTSLSVFSPKDPFVQQVVPPDSSEAPSTTPKSGTPGKQKPEEPPTKFSPGATKVAVTIISVNGKRQALEPGDAFPSSDPVFVLVAERPDAKTAIVGIAGGAYQNGAKTTKLVVGKPLVLENTTTGATYRLVLVAVGSGGASEPSATPKP